MRVAMEMYMEAKTLVNLKTRYQNGLTENWVLKIWYLATALFNCYEWFN